MQDKVAKPKSVAGAVILALLLRPFGMIYVGRCLIAFGYILGFFLLFALMGKTGDSIISIIGLPIYTFYMWIILPYWAATRAKAINQALRKMAAGEDGYILCQDCGKAMSAQSDFCMHCAGTRPKSVTIIAVLQIIGAALGLLWIPLIIYQLADITRLSEAYRLLYADPVLRAWTMTSIPLGAIISLSWLVVAVGLLRMKPVARTAALWLLGFGILMSVAFFFVALKVFLIGPLSAGLLTASKATQDERFLLSFGWLYGSFVPAMYAIILLTVLKNPKVIHAFRVSSQGWNDKKNSTMAP